MPRFPSFVLTSCLSALLTASCSQPAEHTSAPNPTAPTAAQPTPEPAAPVPAPALDTLATYVWESDVCRYTGQYDPRRYTPAQLRGTWDVLNNEALLTYYSTVFRPASLGNLRLDSLEANYAKRRRHYLALEVVPQPVWQQLKQARLRELEADYRKTRLYIQGFTEPELLLGAPYPAACHQFVRGLAAHNDSLIRHDWQELVEQKLRNNADPEALKATYLAHAAAADWLTYAKIDLLTFGWSNCANQSVPRVEVSARQHRLFDQLFVRIASECDEV
ncbi:hypothetical protein [Hymenobacter cellulosivorans]|uniref:Uncharacterized protein n=1 Tax=Hymenobacter cellulosivorans TaxID=2932249 RepID=A0ABY4F6N8_9BACT|nr:hypothetical protein [Hymenobacter cellulosivorans]UOQ51693.1 hypothetical protein MUN80_18245 [Hymenobacter cellulosivorans]